MWVKNIIKNQYIVALIFSCFYVYILLKSIISIKQNYILFFISLLRFYSFQIRLKCECFIINIFQQAEIFCFLIEFLIADHSIFHKQSDIVPLLFKAFTIVIEDFRKFICYFLSDVTVDFLNVGICLQEATRNVKRDIRRINYAV